MFHTMASRVTAMIAVALLLAAGLFAWVRSRARLPSPTPGTQQPAAALALGRDVYAAECGFCHGNQADDRAWLARRADDLYRAEGGDVRLVDFLLTGLGSGGEDLDHPPFDSLSDERIAALLEYLLAYGPAEETAGARPPISTNDIAARRQRD